MRISVDTATDSHEHIRKVIDLLRHIVDGTSTQSSVVEQPAGNPFGDMFGDTPSTPDPTPAPLTPEPSPIGPSQPDPTGTIAGMPTTMNPSSTLDQNMPPTVDVWGNQKEPEKKDPSDDIETY